MATATFKGCIRPANIVIFVNLKDYFEATREAIRQRADPSNPLYLAISYDTDLLAFESIVPYSRKWIEFQSPGAEPVDRDSYEERQLQQSIRP